MKFNVELSPVLESAIRLSQTMLPLPTEYFNWLPRNEVAKTFRSSKFCLSSHHKWYNLLLQYITNALYDPIAFDFRRLVEMGQDGIAEDALKDIYLMSNRRSVMGLRPLIEYRKKIKDKQCRILTPSLPSDARV